MATTTESPNLDSLAGGQPKKKSARVRLLWPKIRACLELGHTVHEIHERLRLDGVKLGYTSLCRCITQLREEDPGAAMASAAANAAGKRPAQRSHGSGPIKDPLDNVRRLTEGNRPGFHYPGTLSDKDLFGE